MHTTHYFKWLWCILTILNISQLQTFIYHIHALQNSWYGHTTLHAAHQKHTTLSPHRRCERTLHFLALVHWWPKRTTNCRCHQQLGPHTTYTPTRVPHTTLQQTSSPEITMVPNTLYNRTSWSTQHALSSDHLTIITTINIPHDHRLQQNWRTLTNYKKADWIQFTEDTELVSLRPQYPPAYILSRESSQTSSWWQRQHIIPKGKMHSNCMLLPDHIVSTPPI